MTPQFIFVALGGILIFTAILGGGFEVREVKIPQVKWPTRIVAFMAGFILVSMGLTDNVSSADRVTGVVEARTTTTTRNDGGRETLPSEIRHETPHEDNAWIRSSLEAAVLKASDAEIRAHLESNPRLLDGLVTGAAYRKIADDITSLASQGLVDVEQLHDQQFESFSVDPSGQHAEVRVVETWSNVLYSTKTNSCLRAFAPYRVPQTASLERQGDRWVLSDFTTYGSGPTETRCQ